MKYLPWVLMASLGIAANDPALADDHRAQAEQLFRHIDADGDGKITPDELASAPHPSTMAPPASGEPPLVFESSGATFPGTSYDVTYKTSPAASDSIEFCLDGGGFSSGIWIYPDAAKPAMDTRGMLYAGFPQCYRAKASDFAPVGQLDLFTPGPLLIPIPRVSRNFESSSATGKKITLTWKQSSD